MADLMKDSIQAWLERLPEDVRSAIPDGAAGDEDAAKAVTEGIKGLATPEQVLEFVDGNGDSFVAMGRARRVRFLAWFASRTYPSRTESFVALTDGEAGDGGQGGRGKVAPFFLEDVRALVEALGPRAARGIVDAAAIEAVAGAGYEVQSELEMRQGGAI